MAMMIKNSRSAIIVTLAALLICSLSSAAWTFQEPKRTPTSQEDRSRALEEIAKQLKGAKAETAETAQGPQAVPAPASPAAAPAPAPPKASPAPGGVQLNFENQDLYDFINQISSTLGLTPLIIDPDVKGTVNLHSGPMAKEDILPLFSLILKNNNAALVQQGGAYQILPISSALKRGVDIIEKLPMTLSDIPERQVQDSGLKPKAPATAPQQVSAQTKAKTSMAAPETQPGGASKLATHVIRAEFVPVKDLIEPVKIFMTEGGVIMPYERLNMLILTDYTDSVSRIVQIIRMLDNDYLDPDLVELVKINNNASSDVADDLKKMFGGSKDSSTGVNFISLDRLNAIFVQASSKRALEEVKGWIQALDSSSSKNIQTYVYAVENSTASNIAMMLSALYGGDEISNQSSNNANNNNTTGGGPFGSGRNAQGTQGGNNASAFNTSAGGSNQGMFGSQSNNGQFGGFNNNGFGGGGSFGAGRQLGPSLNTSRTITSQVLRGGQFTGLQDTVRLVVDDVNNSLIIQATPADYAYVSETIRKMDILPRQALIDARIYEVDLSNTFDFGIAATLQAKGNEKLTTGSLNGDGSGLFSAKTFVPVGDAREIMSALHALSTKTKVKVLEAPSVLALDGQQAQITVGSEVPYPGTSFTSVSGSTSSVQYRDTGVSLIVVPRISASGFVTMDIMQEVSAIGGDVNVGEGSAPSFQKTSVQTTLTVRDGETVAIAGLIRDGNDISRQGLPILSNIPIIGALFGETSKNSHRNELIIMITPHVIRTPEKLHQMTQELRDSLRNVRKYADEKEKESREDMEDARRERYNDSRKSMDKVKELKPEKPVAKSSAPLPAADKPKQ